MANDPLQPIIISSRRRKRRPRRRFLRIGPWVWRATIGALVLGVGGTLVMRAIEPYTMRHRLKQESARIRQSLAQAKEENHALKHQIDLLESGAGLELEARRLGYIRKGEIPLKVTVESQKSK